MAKPRSLSHHLRSPTLHPAAPTPTVNPVAPITHRSPGGSHHPPFTRRLLFPHRSPGGSRHPSFVRTYRRSGRAVRLDLQSSRDEYEHLQCSSTSLQHLISALQMPIFTVVGFQIRPNGGRTSRVENKNRQNLWWFYFFCVPLHRVCEKDSRMMLNSSSN